MKKTNLKTFLVYAACLLLVLTLLFLVWWYFGQHIRLIEENRLKP